MERHELRELMEDALEALKTRRARGLGAGGIGSL